MSSSGATSYPYVLVFGATGATGQDLVDGLLRAGGLRVGAISRSATNPAAEKWKQQGVELRVLDVNKAPQEKIVETLQGVDILLSGVSAEAIGAQRSLFTAAAKVPSLKRVIPSDFGTPCPPGVMDLQDQKNRMHDLIHELGLPYTFIDVGWWKQLTLPYPPSFNGSPVTQWFYDFYGDGNLPILVTDREIIGDFVGRIIKDERTLNQYVIIHEDEVTLEEAWKIAEEESPEGAAIVAKKNPVSFEANFKRIAAAQAAYIKDPSVPNAIGLAYAEYRQSIHFRGDNTLANAKKMGALDARELYPDVKVKTLREYAKGFYAAPKNIR